MIVRNRRWALAAAGAVVIAMGLSVRGLVGGTVGKVAGDALYAILLYLVVAFAAPRLRVATVGALAFAGCAAIEAFQLTGLPASWSVRLPPVRLLLGTTFSWPDLAYYLLGVLVAMSVDQPLARRAPPAER